MQSYVTVEANARFSIADALAATKAIDARLRQRELLRVPRTYRADPIACEYVSLPTAGDITTVAVAARGVRLPARTTATQALTLNGVRLALNEADVALSSETEGTAPPALYYQQVDATTIRFTTAIEGNALVLVEGVQGYGQRRSLNDAGTWSDLTVGEYELLQTTTGDAIPNGTTLTWDGESFVIVSSTTSGGVHTYVVERDDESDHGNAANLWQVNPPHDLAAGARLAAEGVAYRAKQPGAGPAFDADGNVSTNFWNNVDPLIRGYARPPNA